MDDVPTSIPGVTVTIAETAVRVASEQPLTILSSAMVGGGITEARDIVDVHVDDVAPDARPEDDLRAFASGLGITAPFVGLMTAAKTQNARLAEASCDGLTVASVVSVGLEQPELRRRHCAGARDPGTVNALVLIDAALTPAALVECGDRHDRGQGDGARRLGRTRQGRPAGQRRLDRRRGRRRRRQSRCTTPVRSRRSAGWSPARSERRSNGSAASRSRATEDGASTGEAERERRAGTASSTARSCHGAVAGRVGPRSRP